VLTFPLYVEGKVSCEDGKVTILRAPLILPVFQSLDSYYKSPRRSGVAARDEERGISRERGFRNRASATEQFSGPIKVRCLVCRAELENLMDC